MQGYYLQINVTDILTHIFLSQLGFVHEMHNNTSVTILASRGATLVRFASTQL